MKYTLAYKKSAVTELLNLPSEVARRVKPAIDSLIENPRPAGCRKLKGVENSFRIRVGKYRVIYLLSDSVVTITIIKIAHRKSVYR